MCQQGRQAAKEARFWLKHPLSPGRESVVCPDPSPAQRGRSRPWPRALVCPRAGCTPSRSFVSTGTASTSSPTPGPPMLPAMKRQDKKHLQGQAMGTARDTQHEPPRRGAGATEQHTAKQMGYSKCWFSTAMTQPLHGQSADNSDSPSSRTGHGGKRGAQVAAHTQGIPEGQRRQAGQRD